MSKSESGRSLSLSDVFVLLAGLFCLFLIYLIDWYEYWSVRIKEGKQVADSRVNLWDSSEEDYI